MDWSNLNNSSTHTTLPAVNVLEKSYRLYFLYYFCLVAKHKFDAKGSL